MTGPLSNLPLLTGTRSARASSWDRTGGNDDRLTIAPGDTAQLAAIDEPGVVRHIWVTIACDDEDYLRKIVLRMYWDGADSPCVEAPVGDFFGLGHAQHRNFVSAPLQMSPQDGKAFNCWFPMPFDSARLEVGNECATDVIFYYYVDYELTGAPDPRAGRFHAQWRRQNPTDGLADESGLTNSEFQFGGANTDGAGNYVLLDAVGEGHYVGCHVDIENLRQVGPAQFNWYGEGDDMIFVDGEPFPPSLHGTGTEDYFNTAWCPAEEYNAPYHGIVLPGGQNWSGRISLYRYHIEDPVRFQRSIKVTIEHGHDNHRSDDWSSTAYWYQTEPHAPVPPLPPVADRLPRPAERLF
jgi:hypothetical protein